jgi:hypothetical protein
MEEEPKPPTPAAPARTQPLTDSERVVLAHYSGALSVAKAQAHDLLVALDKARAVVSNAEGAYASVLTATTNAHGMVNATLSPDLSTITRNP